MGEMGRSFTDVLSDDGADGDSVCPTDLSCAGNSGGRIPRAMASCQESSGLFSP